MEASHSPLHLTHKHTTPAMLGTVLVETDTAPVNVVGIGLGQSQLVVSRDNLCLFVWLFVWLFLVDLDNAI